MSRIALKDPEKGNNTDGDQTMSAPSQPSSQGKSSFGDSSGPLFSIYSKAAEEDDIKMVERWQKDADRILLFTGLFSIAVAVLLVVSVADLRPNSQDTSAFYLGNIYQFLADSNVTNTSIPSPVSKPPPFSPPRYAVWVNVLWFSSLVMSITCAHLATSLHQWARRFIRLSQPARCSPEKRARMRAFFADGVGKMHIPWAVEGLPMLLHLSLFFFFGGLVIFLFNIDHSVFISVALWVGLFSIMYGLITLLPIIWRDSPYYAPLSVPAWFLYASIRYLSYKALASITSTSSGYDQIRERYGYLRDCYRDWLLGGVEMAAEETVLKRSSEIDLRILSWTIGALGDDDSLERFFEAIPGFFNSKIVYGLRESIPKDLTRKLWDALVGFLGRTLSSNSVIDSVKLHRLDISMDAINLIRDDRLSTILEFIVSEYWDQLPKTVKMGHTLARWCTSKDQSTARHAQCIAALVLVTLPERDDRWVELAARILGLPEQDIRDIARVGDSMSLAILIQVARNLKTFRDLGFLRDILNKFSEVKFLDIAIHNTLPSLQHDFCTLWNEIVQEARHHTISIYILHSIRHLYIALHQGTDAAPTRFSNLTDIDIRLFDQSSYPPCNIVSHRPDHVSVPEFNAAPRQIRLANIPGPPSSSNLITRSKIGDNFQATVTSLALQVHTGLRPTDASPGAVAAPTPHVPASTPPVLNRSLTPSDAGAVSTPNPLLPASSVIGLSTPASLPPSLVPPSPNSEFAAFLSSIKLSRPIGNVTLPRLRVRGIVNTGNNSFANAVLQLLVHSPPLWNLFSELGDLKRRGAGAPETGGGATPLVDATARFFKEYMFEKKEAHPQQQAATGKPREDEEEKKESKVVDSIEPLYMYDAMKEKRRLKQLLDGKQQDAEEFLRLYLDALDEEFELHPYISTLELAPALSVEGLEEGAQSAKGQTEDRKTASLVESPISGIFGGRSRSIVRAPSQPDTVTTPVSEPWRTLQLDIQSDSIYTIQDALAGASRPQPVQVGQPSSSEASQQELLEVLPPILVLHLKRFLYDSAANEINKISKTVQFAPELEIPPEIMTTVSEKPAEPVHYMLYGVLYAYGKSASNVHYTVDVLNGESGGEAWLHIDDEVVSTVRHEDVFGWNDNEPGDERCAYMLFYCRTASART